MTGQFLGQILAVGFNFSPKGWTACNAATLAINQNQALFSLLGTVYGGNGVSTFGLPDLRGRTAIHWGQGLGLPNYNLGEIAGTQSVTLLTSQLPLHNHSMSVSSAASNAPSPGGNVFAQGPLSGTTPVAVYATAGGAAMATGAMAPSGGNQPVPILQPYNVLNYIICMSGLYPSRN